MSYETLRDTTDEIQQHNTCSRNRSYGCSVERPALTVMFLWSMVCEQCPQQWSRQPTADDTDDSDEAGLTARQTGAEQARQV